MTAAIWDLLLAERGLLSALGPLAGDRAEGNVVATATAAPVILPPFTYGVPIIGSKAYYSKMFRVLSTRPVNVEAVGPTVTNAGTSVAVRSVCGGAAGNLSAGTPFVWQPAIGGIQRYGVIGAGGLTGGTESDSPGRCARVVAFDTLARDEVTKRIWEAQGEGFPAIVVSYTGDRFVDDATVASAIIEHLFKVYIVAANYTDNDERQIEGKLLIAAVRDALQGLADAEGDVFSGVPCEVGAVQALAFAPTSHVFSIDVSITDAPRRVDKRLTDGVSWQPWATTRIAITVPAAAPLEERTVVDVTAEET